MQVNEQDLSAWAADFDGDVLNVHYIINEDFRKACEERLSPKNCMISRNDGWFNNDLNHTKDLLINMNTLVNLTRKHYNQQQIDKIKRIKQMNSIII